MRNQPEKILFQCELVDELFMNQSKTLVIFEESSNCKMGKRGTIKCRPTVAYCVQGDGIIISD